MKRLPAALIGWIFLLALSAAQAAPALQTARYSGTAKGNLTIDGKPIPLKYAYAVEVDNVEDAGLGMEINPQKYLVLILSDRELPLFSLANRYAPYADRLSPGQIMEPPKKGVADKMYGVLLKFEPAKKVPFDAQFLYPSDNLHMTVSGTMYPDRLTTFKRAGSRVSGTAVLAAPQATYLEKGPKKYQYRVSFDAPVLAEPPVKEKLDGQAALDSAPVQTLRNYLTAAKKGDVDALRGLTAPTHHTYLKNPEVIKYLQSAELSKVAEQVKRVVIRGNTASIQIINETPTFSQVNMHLIRENGTWKLLWP